MSFVDIVNGLTQGIGDIQEDSNDDLLSRLIAFTIETIPQALIQEFMEQAYSSTAMLTKLRVNVERLVQRKTMSKIITKTAEEARNKIVKMVKHKSTTNFDGLRKHIGGVLPLLFAFCIAGLIDKLLDEDSGETEGEDRERLLSAKAQQQRGVGTVEWYKSERGGDLRFTSMGGQDEACQKARRAVYREFEKALGSTEKDKLEEQVACYRIWLGIFAPLLYKDVMLFFAEAIVASDTQSTSGEGGGGGMEGNSELLGGRGRGGRCRVSYHGESQGRWGHSLE